MTDMITQPYVGGARRRVRMVISAWALPILMSTALLAGCAGYVPGQKAYWDARVKEFCERDGHVQVLEQTVLTKTEADELPRRNGKLSLRMKGSASEHDPFYVESSQANMRNSNPQILRIEWRVVRRIDKKVVGSWFSYVRRGGDLPTHAHPSSFACPDWDQTWAELQALFIIKEE